MLANGLREPATAPRMTLRLLRKRSNLLFREEKTALRSRLGRGYFRRTGVGNSERGPGCQTDHCPLAAIAPPGQAGQRRQRLLKCWADSRSRPAVPASGQTEREGST